MVHSADSGPRLRQGALRRLPGLIGLLGLLCASPASAQEPGPAAQLRWDYLPVVGYIGDDLWFSLRVDARSAASWTVSADSEQVVAQTGADGASIDVGIPLEAKR